MHWVKSVHIQSFSGPYFPTFGLNTEIYSVNFRIQSECEKIWTRVTPNTDTFYAMMKYLNMCKIPFCSHYRKLRSQVFSGALARRLLNWSHLLMENGELHFLCGAKRALTTKG